MKRLVIILLSIVGLAMSNASRVSAQGLSVDQFLQRVPAHPDSDEVEQRRSSEIYQFLASASPAEVKKEIPILLQYTRSGNDIHARRYALLFLTAVAIRLDGGELLSASSEEISSLILDSNPDVQRGAIVVMDYVLAKAGTNKQPYLSALLTALQKTQTPQDSAKDTIGPLLAYDQSDPAVLKSVLAFMQRDDLTLSTRLDLLHELGDMSGLPAEVTQALVKELDDPDPRVRAAGVVAFAHSTNEFYTIDFHTLAKDRVARMANDPKENPEVREKAKQAIAGKTNLDPNIYSLPENRKDR